MDMTGLRAWQAEAAQQFLDAGPRDWLTSATPGAGKTTYSLRIARHMLDRGFVDRVIVVCPTDHLRKQWVEAAARFEIDLRPTPNSERLPQDATGCVVTYAQVAMAPRLHAARCETHRTFVIFDEVHHAGDDLSWGSAVLDAFDQAVVRFGVTGTPYRSDDAQIAHVTYEVDDETGGLRSRPDYVYGYAQALRDRVVRPVMFAAYAGQAEWQDADGALQKVLLGDPTLSRAAEKEAWRTILDPGGEWIAHVMDAAWTRVRLLRASTIPDAAVLIPASSQEQARAYARVWEQVTGNKAAVALSDDPGSAEVIERFRDDPELVCLVCVRLVTEGVDIPRCAVLVWATTACTPLFFAQMVGRVVRSRDPREQATVFLPAVLPLLSLAATMEREREHVIEALGDETDDLLLGDPDDATGDDDAGDDEVGSTWKAVTSEAAFERVLSTAHLAPPEAEELFGIGGLLTPEQEAAILAREDEQRRERARQARLVAQREALTQTQRHQQTIREAQQQGVPIPAATRALLDAAAKAQAEAAAGADLSAKELRQMIARAVARRAGLTHSEPVKVWGKLYSAVPGPKNDQATVALLRKRFVYTQTHW